MTELLNAEQIALRRIPLEDAEVKLSRVSNWHCHYCNRRFSGEHVFMKHVCEPRRRTQELLAPIGQAAFGYYREWMRLKKFSQPGAAAFMESKFYRSFIKFAQMVMDANISKPDKFIEMMVAGDISPTLWCRNSAYSIYLDWIDKLTDPLEQVGDTINYLMDVSEREGIKLDQVFGHLGVQQILSLIRQHRLTPWFMFFSKSFKSFYNAAFDDAQKAVFRDIINAGYWADRFKIEKSTVKNVESVITEMGL